MTREEKLITMNRQTLKDIAERHGLKVKSKDSTDKIRKMILKFEGEAAAPAPSRASTSAPMRASEKTDAKAKAEDALKKTRGEKRVGPAARIVITHNGKTQGMCAWAREIGIHPNLLYYRIKAGWPTEKALTPAREKKAK